MDEDEDDDPFAAPRAVSTDSEYEDNYGASEGSDSGVVSRSRTKETSEEEENGGMSDGSDASGVSGTDSEASSLLGQRQPRDSDDDSTSEEDSETQVADTRHHIRPTLAKSSTRTNPLTDRDKLRRLALDEVDVTSSLSTAATADAKKGKAVKQQYRAFDRLLDARIKLQKGLTVVETLDDVSRHQEIAENVIERAEQAALNLWSTIKSLRLHVSRANIDPETSSKRRKISPPLPSPPTAQTPLSDLWSRQESLESSSMTHRRSVINKWSAKSRSGSSLNAQTTPKANANHGDTNPVTMLDDHLAGPAFTALLSESTSGPTTTSNSNDSANPTSSTTTPLSSHTYTYTDTPFYQSLLRDLIAQRTRLSSSAPHTSAFPPTPIPPQPAKQKKQVDTRASKGRKVRYTVHEKLVNHETRESRQTWTNSARGEFFGSLFGGENSSKRNGEGGMGGRMNGVNGGAGEGDTDGEDGEEGQALRLFSGRR